MKKNLFKVVSLVLVLSILVASVFVLCSCNKDDSNPNFFSEDKHFDLDLSYINFMGTELDLSDMSDIVDMVLDKENTYFTFTDDGEFHFQIATTDMVMTLLQGIVTDDALKDFDLDASINSFVEPLFPGFKQKLYVEKDLYGGLDLMYKSMGLGIRGLDVTDEGVKDIIDAIAEDHQLPSGFIKDIPTDTKLRVYFDQQYRLVSEKTYTGETMNMIYFGGEVAHNDKTQPYGILSITNTDSGKMLLTFRLEVLNVTLRLIEK